MAVALSSLSIQNQKVPVEWPGSLLRLFKGSDHNPSSGERPALEEALVSGASTCHPHTG